MLKHRGLMNIASDSICLGITRKHPLSRRAAHAAYAVIGSWANNTTQRM